MVWVDLLFSLYFDIVLLCQYGLYRKVKHKVEHNRRMEDLTNSLFDGRYDPSHVTTKQFFNVLHQKWCTKSTAAHIYLTPLPSTSFFRTYNPNHYML